MKKFISLFVLTLLMSACGKPKDDPKPNVTAIIVTGEVSEITPSSARASGAVVTDGNPVITERGFVYGTTSNPTIDASKVSAGSGKGVFSAVLTTLTPGTTYHVRAYATNTAGIAYGENRTFTTGTTLPALTTTAPTSVSAVSVTSGGNITSDGGTAITSRGICWNTTGTPTLADNKTSDGTGAGNFSSTLTGLNSNTKIFIRAYATNSIGTTYGNQIEVSTLKTIPTNGLISWWPLDGDTQDASGKGNHATNYGAALSSDRKDRANSSLQFDGSDYVLAKSVEFTDLSFSAWYSLDNDSNLNPPVGFPPSGSQLLGQGTEHFPIAYSDFSFGITTYNSATPQYGIEQGGTLGVAAYYVDAPIAYQSWVHVACVISGTTVEVYQNGVLKGTFATSSNFYRNGNILSIGSRYIENCCVNGGTNPVTNQFKGKIDDVAIWNRKLSAQEVQKIYNESGF